MFNMSKVGQKIAKLRKEQNITQLSLADQLGVSYQAISNWERGQSMPDISKLPELARIFDESIEEILEGKGAALVEQVVSGEELSSPIDKEELLEAAPVLTTYQTDQVFRLLGEELSSEDIPCLAPYLSQDILDDLVLKIKDIKSLTATAPYVSQSVLDKLARHQLNEYGPNALPALAPFLSQECMDECARESEGKDLAAIAPFISKETLDEIAGNLYKSEGIGSLASIAPFISKPTLQSLAEKVMAEKGVKELYPILPFLDLKNSPVQ